MAENTFERVQQRLDQAGCPYELIDHPPVATTQDAAAAGGVSGYHFAKAVVAAIDDRPHLYVLRAADTLDLDALRAQLGGRQVRLASEEEFQDLYPGAQGAIPPIAFQDDLPVHVDRRLADHGQQIAFEAGDGRHSIRMAVDHYMRLAGAEKGDFAEPPRRRRRRRPRRARAGAWTVGLGLASLAAGLALVRPRRLGRAAPMRAGRIFTAGAVTGGALALLADPNSGARRRHLVRDKAGKWARKAAWLTRRKSAYYSGRIEGIQHELEEVARMDR
jgi:Ala-tRNA(Pro) deacylase